MHDYLLTVDLLIFCVKITMMLNIIHCFYYHINILDNIPRVLLTLHTILNKISKENS